MIAPGPTLEAWRTEIDGRVHGIVLAYKKHGSFLRALAQTLAGAAMRLVHLEQLDPLFASGSYRCFACQVGSEVGAGSLPHRSRARWRKASPRACTAQGEEVPTKAKGGPEPYSQGGSA